MLRKRILIALLIAVFLLPCLVSCANHVEPPDDPEPCLLCGGNACVCPPDDPEPCPLCGGNACVCPPDDPEPCLLCGGSACVCPPDDPELCPLCGESPCVCPPEETVVNYETPVPLTDLGKNTYKGYEGGLYRGGSNEPPPEYLAKGMEKSALIQPLDKDGKPAANGVIGMISIGFSNTTQEFSEFKRLADADPERNPSLKLVDCAVGSRDA
ncbi:MAG: hypothetical protein FWE85_03195, partial [Clostridiales bacterium]|nr:hypothetical protein [Clostridiales bacterium]